MVASDMKNKLRGDNFWRTHIMACKGVYDAWNCKQKGICEEIKTKLGRIENKSFF